MDPLQERSQLDHNDSDDWTLITPPRNSPSGYSPGSSSPLPGQHFISEIDMKSRCKLSSTASASICLADDGHEMEEIDLEEPLMSNMKSVKFNDNHENSPKQSTSQSRCRREHDENNPHSYTDEHYPGFQPLDTTSEEDNASNLSSRRSSLTQSELGEYVDLGEKSKVIIDHEEDNCCEDKISEDLDVDGSKVAMKPIAIDENSCGRLSNIAESIDLSSIRARLDELSEASNSVSLLGQQPNYHVRQTLSQLFEGIGPYRGSTRQMVAIHIMVLAAHVTSHYLSSSPSSKSDRRTDEHPSEKIYKVGDTIAPERWRSPIPANYRIDIPYTQSQYDELKSLNLELSECIKRQNPASYMSDFRKKHPSINPSDNLVCYGQTRHWRIRLGHLKSKFRLDLVRLIQDIKKQVSIDLLESHHPLLQFKLVLNQLEYHHFLRQQDSERYRKSYVRRLEQTNLKLEQELEKPNSSKYQKLIVNMELENSKLRRDNEALKASLVEKAGPTYMKQSLELERLMRENVMLKEFHNQVAQAIAKTSRLLDLPSVDVFTNVDDHEGLKSQLSISRNLLDRFTERTSHIVTQNHLLERRLEEIMPPEGQSSIGLSAVAQLLPSQNKESDLEHGAKALTGADTPCHSRLASVERELEQVRTACSKQTGLEPTSSRNLNRSSSSFDDRQSHMNALKTRIDQSLGRLNRTLNVDDTMIDELIVFLTRFTDQVEANGLISQGTSIPISDIPLLPNNRRISQTNSDEKIIPNYIRDIVRSPKSSLAPKSHLMVDSWASNVPPQLPTELWGENLSSASPANVDITSCNPPSDPTNTCLSSFQPLPRLSVEVAPLAKRIHIGNVEHSNQKMVSDESNWFLSRSDIRSQLRSDQEKPSYSAFYHYRYKNNTTNRADHWLLKRAKLREQLRKVSSYLDRQHKLNSTIRDPKRTCQESRVDSNQKQRRQTPSSNGASPSGGPKKRSRESSKPPKKKCRHDHSRHGLNKSILHLSSPSYNSSVSWPIDGQIF